jgi:2-oxoglutarate ferredoxin oxidoreductase subunit beta
MNKFPTGVLKHNESAREYCDMYKEIQAVHQGKRKALTQDDFAKKI